MTKLKSIAVLPALAVTLLTGCAPTTPHWDQRFGESQRMMMAQQVMNPDAGLKELPPWMDGPASRESVLRYRSTFREPSPPQNVFNIGVGSGGR